MKGENEPCLNLSGYLAYANALTGSDCLASNPVHYEAMIGRPATTGPQIQRAADLFENYPRAPKAKTNLEAMNRLAIFIIAS